MKLIKGQWIRKENWTLFKPMKGNDVPNVGPEYWNQPIMKVISFNPIPDRRGFNLNGRNFSDQTKIVVIDEHEAERIMIEWDKCQLVETTHANDITSCVREDNGQPKNKILTEQTAREILFQWRMKFPDLPFDGYKCAHCGHFHIGKRKEVTPEKSLKIDI